MANDNEGQSDQVLVAPGGLVFDCENCVTPDAPDGWLHSPYECTDEFDGQRRHCGGYTHYQAFSFPNPPYYSGSNLPPPFNDPDYCLAPFPEVQRTLRPVSRMVHRAGVDGVHSSNGRYGPRAVLGGLSDSEGWGEDNLLGLLAPGSSGRYGPSLIARTGGGCQHRMRVRDFPIGTDPITGESRFREASPRRARAYVGAVGRYGPRQDFVAPISCEPSEVLEGPEVKGLYYANIANTECLYCDTLLWTLEPPCMGCTWDRYVRPSGEVFCPPGDTCFIGGDENAGQPCNSEIQPEEDWECESYFPWPAICKDDPTHPWCQWYNDDYMVGCNSSSPHNDCPSCLHKRMMGYMVNHALKVTDATKRIELVADRDLQDGPCGYGCGRFGWHMPQSKRLSPQVCDDDWCVVRGPCEGYHQRCSGNEDCSGDQMDQDVACVGDVRIGWDSDSFSNRIEAARICFTELEACDPQFEPCFTNPCHDCAPDSYHNPSAEVIVYMSCYIRIKLRMWICDGATFPECCCILHGCTDPAHEQSPIDIIVEGRYNGAVPWGNREGWNGWRGYKLKEDRLSFIEHGWRDRCDPTDSYDQGSCMNLFVNQGLTTDWEPDHDNNGLPKYETPPKQCPSFRVRDGQPNDQFFCLPLMTWTWNYGTKKHRTRHCMDVQGIRNGVGCGAGADSGPLTGQSPVTANKRYECSRVACRRGCSIGDYGRDQEYDAVCGERKQPFENRPLQLDAKPWSCGHCI